MGVPEPARVCAVPGLPSFARLPCPVVVGARGSAAVPEPARCNGEAGQEKASLRCGPGLRHLPSDVCRLLSGPPPLVVV